ncbi:TerD family protein [Streptomyces sp. NPDC059816]|uniref:TerD family protein n=1 Tax=Streptomyces sp. NPDC059816 TaxID=3346960 RepID=UPI00365291F3
MAKGTNAVVPTTAVRVELEWGAGPGVPRVDSVALLLVGGRVRGDGDVIRPARPDDPAAALRYEDGHGGNGRATDTLAVDLARVDDAVERIVLVVSTASGTFGQVPRPGVRVLDAARGTELARFDCADATVETALVLGELYRRGGGWKFRAVGQGYGEGRRALAEDFGVTPAALAPAPDAPPPPAAPAPTRAPARPPTPDPPTTPVRLSKVTLTKDAPAVSLAKQGGTGGTLHVNLNWGVRERPQDRGSRWRRPRGPHRNLDLDLCALYELTDGRKGVVQALGHAYGALHAPPYVHLDGDDRTGAAEGGENLTINLDHRTALRRVLVFVMIYEGADSFADLHATVTLRPQHGAPIEFFLDECTVTSPVCALALLTQEGGDLVVRREARYLVPEPGMGIQRTVDHAYGWGLTWTPGRK